MHRRLLGPAAAKKIFRETKKKKRREKRETEELERVSHRKKKKRHGFQHEKKVIARSELRRKRTEIEDCIVQLTNSPKNLSCVGWTMTTATKRNHKKK